MWSQQVHKPAGEAPCGAPRPNHLDGLCDGSCHTCHRRDPTTHSGRAAGSSRRCWPGVSARRPSSRRASRGPARVSPQHTALLGDWAIGKTTLLMHWRRLRQHAGDAVVLSMAYPQPPDEFLGRSGRRDRGRARDRLAGAARPRDWSRHRDRRRPPASIRPVSRSRAASCTLRRLVDRARGARSGRRSCFVDDIDLVPDPAMFCCSCGRAPSSSTRPTSAVRLRGGRVAGPVRGRFGRPTSRSCASSSRSRSDRSMPAAADSGDHRAARGDAGPVRRRGRRPRSSSSSGGRPYYLQKLAYYAFDAATNGRVSPGGVRRRVRARLCLGQPGDLRRHGGRRCPRSSARSSVVTSRAAPSRGRQATSRPRRRGVVSRPSATRQALRRLAARGPRRSARRRACAAATRCGIGSSGATWSCRRASRRGPGAALRRAVAARPH